MSEVDPREIIYLRSYSILILVLSVFSIITLLISDFAWWEDNLLIQVRLSSTFRLSILIILPLLLGFLANGTIAGLMMFTEIGDKENWNKIVFWISIGVFTLTIIAAGALLITFSTIATRWGYGNALYSALICSIITSVFSVLYFKVRQEISS